MRADDVRRYSRILIPGSAIEMLGGVEEDSEVAGSGAR
jgi:hypothetical protein